MSFKVSVTSDTQDIFDAFDKLPSFMENERKLLICVKNSIIDAKHYAYLGTNYENHDSVLWNKLCETIRQHELLIKGEKI